MYHNITEKTYAEYENRVKKMLREQLSAISEAEFEKYFDECKSDIKADYESKEPDGAALLSYGLFMNY